MDNGGAVYMEGANVASDVDGTDFIEYFGAVATSAGAGAGVMDVLGMDGTFAANTAFDYPYGTDTDYNLDELAADTGTEFLTCQNETPRAVYYNSGSHRAIISSVVIGGFKDGEGSNTKASLMTRYINYLTGIEAADINIANEEIDFGVQYVNYAFDFELAIQNFGLADLEITSVEVVGNGFSSTVTGPFTLEIGEEFLIPVTFEQSASGNYTGTLTIVSNDPDESELVIPLYAECLMPPVCQLPGDTIEGYAQEGESSMMAYTITNAGDSDLTFMLNIDEVEEVAQVFTPVYENVQLGKDEIDWREGYINTRGSGGPDNFGYKWKDSNEDCGPVYEWFDISDIGENSNLTGDDSSVSLDLPFEFDFYGEPKTSVLVSDNGYLTFGGSAAVWMNTELLDPNPPNDIICPFWDDLNPQNGGVNYNYYDQDNGRFIIQYDEWAYYSGGSPQTFQVQLYMNGKIRFLYESMDGGGTPTIGIENSVGDDGLQITFNEPYVENGMVIEFSCGPDWIDTDISSGTIAAGESQDIMFTFDAINFHDGDYEAVAYLSTNDPANPEYVLPIILHVGNVDADDDFIPTRTALFDNYPNPFNPETKISYSLKNECDVDLIVYNVRGQKIKTLHQGNQTAGAYELIWNGMDDNDRPVSSGIYYYRLDTKDYSSTKKMLLLK